MRRFWRGPAWTFRLLWLLYRLSGQQCLVEDSLIDKYRKGTKPEGPVDAEEMQRIKSLLPQLATKSQADYKEGIFSSYKSYPTSYKVQLESIEDAVFFNNVHEGMHFGTILALRKLV